MFISTSGQSAFSQRSRRGGILLDSSGPPPAGSCCWTPSRRHRSSPPTTTPSAARTSCDADGLDGALIALSSPLGIESLPAGEAEPLLEAYHEGVQALGAPFGWWGAVALDRPRGRRGRPAARRGRDGHLDARRRARLPARARPRRARCSSASSATARRSSSTPGPAPWRPMAWTGSAFPGWWPALTAYVTQLHEAWHAWMAWGRAAAPAAHRRLGDARRRRAAARRAARRARRAGVDGPLLVLRRLLVRARRGRRDGGRGRRRPARLRLRPARGRRRRSCPPGSPARCRPTPRSHAGRAVAA